MSRTLNNLVKILEESLKVIEEAKDIREGIGRQLNKLLNDYESPLNVLNENKKKFEYNKKRISDYEILANNIRTYLGKGEGYEKEKN